tara:strand:- start:2676 stop:2870 length:195 start_codon:yes stop_codon:yes gene_type:complete
MLPIKFLEDLSDDNKDLLKKIFIAALFVYVLFQLFAFFFPIAVTLVASYLAYKKFVEPNPRILR